MLSVGTAVGNSDGSGEGARVGKKGFTTGVVTGISDGEGEGSLVGKPNGLRRELGQHQWGRELGKRLGLEQHLWGRELGQCLVQRQVRQLKRKLVEGQALTFPRSSSVILGGLNLQLVVWQMGKIC